MLVAKWFSVSSILSPFMRWSLTFCCKQETTLFLLFFIDLSLAWTQEILFFSVVCNLLLYVIVLVPMLFQIRHGQ